MIIVNYASKKQMKDSVGQRLDYTETSFFGNEVTNVGIETVTGSNRPSINTRADRKWREFL